MTKARVNADNASADIQGVTAGTGLSGGGTSGTVTLDVDTAVIQARVANVTDTEIGYLDGVTSAIQTQINSKIGQATAINPTIVDAKGDLIAATAADTVSRLAVGSNGQVLKANSGTATGLEWGAASATKSYSLLGTATLTGAGTITISGLSGYDNLMITVDTAQGPLNGIMTMRFNASTGPYPQFGQSQSQGTAWSVYVFQANTQPAASSISFGNMSNNIASSVSGIVQVLGANGSGMKAWTSASGSVSNGAITTLNYIGGGMFEPTAVISSVSIICNAGGNNFIGGTMKVYGAV